MPEEGFYPSRSWAVAYIETNRLIRDLNDHLKSFLEEAGYRTVDTPATHNYDPAILLSDWSHRHIAYIAGLGRLGLNQWLITAKGCCGRLGSFVTEALFSPTPRPKHEFCLHFAGKKCSACVKNCIYGALSLSDLIVMPVINSFSKTLPAFLTWEWPMSAENVGSAFHAAPLIRFQCGRGARYKNPFPYPQELA